MATIASLDIRIRALTGGFAQGLQRASNTLTKFRRRLLGGRNATIGLSRALATAAPIGFGSALLKLVFAGERFNRAMNQSLAITNDVSQALRRDMVNAALKAASVTKSSSEDVAETFFFLISAGLNLEQSIAALPQVAQFAQAGMFDLARATELLAGSQAAMGLTSKDAIKNLQQMKRVSDVLVKANQLSQATTEQFAEALGNKAAARMKILNISLEEGVALLAALAKRNIKGAEAGTALDIALRELTARADMNAKTFKDLRVEVFKTSGQMKPLADVIEDLENLLDALSPRQRIATLRMLGFQQRSVSFIQTLLGLSQEVRNFNSALHKAGNTTEFVAKKQLTPLQKAFALAEASITKLSLVITPLLNDFARVIKLVAMLIDKAADFLKATGLLESGVFRFAVVAATVSIALSGLVKVLSVVLGFLAGPLISVFTLVGVAGQAAFAVLLSTVGQLVALLTSLAALVLVVADRFASLVLTVKTAKFKADVDAASPSPFFKDGKFTNTPEAKAEAQQSLQKLQVDRQTFIRDLTLPGFQKSDLQKILDKLAELVDTTKQTGRDIIDSTAL